MKLYFKGGEIRSWMSSDAEPITGYANNYKIWINLRDGFPHPYTVNDAHQFIERAMEQKPESFFAISIKGEAIGSIGFRVKTDVERVSAEIGYWLAEPFWNRGIMTSALKSVTDYAIKTHNLCRVYAVPYEWNHASFRVLEKAGYKLEGRMRKSAIKEDKIIDMLLYAFVPDI